MQRNVLVYHPNWPAIEKHLNELDRHIANKSDDQVLAEYYNIKKLQPNFISSNFYEAEVLRIQGRYAMAITMYEEAAKYGDYNFFDKKELSKRINSEQTTCRIKLIKECVELKKFADAFKVFNSIPDPSHDVNVCGRELYFAHSEYEYANGNYQAACESLSIACERYSHPDALSHLSKAVIKIGNIKKDNEYLSFVIGKLYRYASTPASYYLARGQLYLAAGQPDCAMRDFTSAIKDGTAEIKSQAHFYLAKMYYKDKQFEIAKSQTISALESNTKFAMAWVLLARISAKLGNFTAAYQHLHDAEEIDPNLSEKIEILRALIVNEQGDYTKAFTSVCGAIVKFPENIPLRVALENLICSENNARSSKADIFSAIKLLPKEKQVELFKMCLDKESKLGERMWRKEGLFSCSVTRGTLSQILQCLKELVPTYKYEANVSSSAKSNGLLFAESQPVNEVAAPVHNRQNDTFTNIHYNSL